MYACVFPHTLRCLSVHYQNRRVWSMPITGLIPGVTLAIGFPAALVCGARIPEFWPDDGSEGSGPVPFVGLPGLKFNIIAFYDFYDFILCGTLRVFVKNTLYKMDF